MRKLLAITGLALLSSGCDNSMVPSQVIQHPTVPALLTLTPSSVTVMTAAGDTRTVTAVVKNAGGGVVPSPDLQWSSNASNVATVTDNGAGGATVVAIDDGVVTITARSGSVESSVQFSVHRVLASIAFVTPHHVLEYGSTTQFVVTAFDARHNAMTNVQGFKFSSDNPSSAFVSPSGAVTALFRFPQLFDAVITASLTRDSITATTKTTVIPSEPSDTDFGALLLTEFVQPDRPGTLGSGIALMKREVDRISYRVMWSDLTGTATSVQIRGPAEQQGNGDLLVNLGPLPLQDSVSLITNNITGANIRSQNGRAPISLDSLSALMCHAKAYIEVRSIRFPNGELRGQFTCFE